MGEMLRYLLGAGLLIFIAFMVAVLVMPDRWWRVWSSRRERRIWCVWKDTRGHIGLMRLSVYLRVSRRYWKENHGAAFLKREMNERHGVTVVPNRADVIALDAMALPPKQLQILLNLAPRRQTCQFFVPIEFSAQPDSFESAYRKLSGHAWEKLEGDNAGIDHNPCIDEANGLSVLRGYFKSLF